MGLFAGLALAITAAGLGGVIAFSVNQRTQEFGVRMALGASRGSLLRMVLTQALKLVAVGLAIGIAAALASGRAIRTLLFDVTTTDAPTFAAVALAFVVVAGLACAVPARRAASVDPMVALRGD
jgi:putative ABC transport system permease protein